MNIVAAKPVLLSWDMFVDSKKILEKVRLKGESQKGRVGLYLDKALFKEFQRICGDASASEVVEELVRQFVESAKKKG